MKSKVNKIIKSEYTHYILISIFCMFFIYLLGIKLYDKNVFNIMKDDIVMQYSHLYSYMKNSILNGYFPTYSFSLGIGDNFIGTYAYYCTSFFNLILIFSNLKTIPVFLSVVAILKIIVSGLTMKIYLNSQSKNKMYSTLFALMYSFCSYTLIYINHLMWLDVLIMLPLVALGVEKLVKENKCKLYIISLSLSIFFNFYISFSVCMFSVFYFIFQSIINKKWNVKKFIFSSLFCGLVNAWLLIPMIFNMFSGKIGVTVFSSVSVFNYELIEIIPRFLIGNLSLTNSIGLSRFINVYSGLLIIILILVGLINKNINFKEKFGYIILILIFIICMFYTPLDTILHCFAVPDYYPYRYAFIISFLMIALVYKTFSLKKSFNKRNLLPGLMLISIIVLLYKSGEVNFSKSIFYINIIFIIIYSVLLSFNLKFNKIIICFLVFIEIVINSSILLHNTIINSKDSYIVSKYENLVNKIKNDDKTLYRVDYKTNAEHINYNWNDSLSYGTFGTQVFFPTISSNMYSILLDVIGYSSGMLIPPPISNANATSFSNAFLGVKYTLIDENSYSKNESFPLFFRTNKFENFEISELKLKNQNNIFKILSGEDLYYEISCEKDQYCSCIILGTSDCEEYKNEYSYYVETDDVNSKLIGTLENLKFNFNDTSHVYNLDETKIEKLSEKLKAQELLISQFKENHIIGSISNNSINQVLFTSIPYDQGWIVKVNDKKVETYKTLDSLLAFDLPIGDLDIELLYVPKGLVSGIILSVMSCLYLLIVYNKKILDALNKNLITHFKRSLR